MHWVEADRCGKPTEFTRDTYLLLWWYVRQSESLTVESTVPRPFKPTEFIRGTYLLLWWYVRQSDSLTFESTVPRPCLWSPGLAHSLNPYSLSIRCACTVVSGTDGDESCHSV